MSCFPKALVLAGPTASGKTEVAHCLAKRLELPVLSADSMSVYRGMDVGTAKPTAEQRREVCYYGLDLVEPSARFSVGDYVHAARKVLADVKRSGHEWILIAGGTGLYLKALLFGLDDLPASDPARRAYWERRLQEQGIAALRQAAEPAGEAWHNVLATCENARRFIRALELIEQGVSAPPAGWQARAGGLPAAAGLLPQREVLNERIAIRARAMLDGSLLEEARMLQAGGGLSATAEQAIGYAEAFAVLAGTLSREAALERIAARTRQLAKRQRTWFRHQLPMEWIQVEPERTLAETADAVERIWREHGAIDLQ